MTLFRDSKNKTKFVPIKAKSVWDKNDDFLEDIVEIERCPSHDNPIKPIKWEDVIGDFPDVKEDDVIDIYVYKNGVLIWPKK